MEELVEKIRSNKRLRLGERANTKYIIDCKNYLSANKQVVFPDDYSTFMKYINGIVSDTVEIYGVLPNKNHGFSDIVIENRKHELFDKKRYIVIGSNSFDFLVYDKYLNQYQARNKDDGIVFGAFEDVQKALSYLLEIH